ncbi:MAG: hypothetical protein K2N78_07510 [Oscillospiraceae bacterium]|nr:hypothetical protein [Oscillospiraceae bacterium]
MIFTMPSLGLSLANYLKPELPGVRFFSDPNQQGTATPALFLRQTFAKISPQPGGLFLRKLGLDLVYLVRFYDTREDTRLQAAADVMDQMLDTFPYASEEGEKPVRLRAYGRHWEITDSTLHYKFELRLRLTKAEDAALMRSIQELNMEVKP